MGQIDNAQCGANRHQATRSGWGTDVTELFVVITVIVVALIFDFTNGFHDSANAMAGPVATGALRPRTALILAALLNVVGACLSIEVAKTISGGLFDVTIVYEDDTVVEVWALTRTGLILTEARFDQTERGLQWLAAALAVQS